MEDNRNEENRLIYGRNAVMEALLSESVIDTALVNQRHNFVFGSSAEALAQRRPQQCRKPLLQKHKREQQPVFEALFIFLFSPVSVHDNPFPVKKCKPQNSLHTF